MSRGTLRIYLGAAPGVGKTFAMLNEGCRRRERGTDVVVGYVETHGRANTAAQLRDLEVIPRKQLDYRGSTFEEMDVDAILARRPAVALVDELAHTNVPGSRNEKRWQDIEELLDAGINVISTLNIQHLESLNDVVERITGMPQRETVPDEVVRRADQIELVDMAPEAIRRRMAHGNIYPPERVDASLANYFRPGNLAALRELALLWVADRVDESLQDYRERHGIDRPWETRERVVVALTGAAGGDRLIRRAARMAQRARAELVAVHVRSQDGLAATPGEELESQRALVEELGGDYRETVGADIGQALVATARQLNATQIVLGASRRSRWAELTRGSVINTVIRESGIGIDVHVISQDPTATDTGLPRRRRPAALPPRRQVLGLALAVVGAPLLTYVLSHLRDHVGLPSILLLYLLLVIAVSAVGGLWPALAAAVGGFLLVNWYFTPPLYTFTIAETENLFALFVFLVVAGTVSAFVALAARRAAEGARARAEAEALARLAGASSVPTLLESIRRVFGQDGVALLHRDGDDWRVDATAGQSAPADRAAAGVRARARRRSRPPAQPSRARTRTAACSTRSPPSSPPRSSCGSSRRRPPAPTSSLRRASSGRRSSRPSPTTSARRSPGSRRPSRACSSTTSTGAPEAQRSFLETIDEETDRLNALVGNLLDMSRLQTGALDVSQTAIGLEEVVASTLASLGPRAEAVEVDVPETLPRVLADPGLLERALANIVANAVGWAPPDSPVRIGAGEVGDGVDLRVVDRGPGIAVADRERVFQPFQRLGDSASGEGVGLGLAVAKGFVEAMGGELELEDTPGGGLTMVIRLRQAP